MFFIFYFSNIFPLMNRHYYTKNNYLSTSTADKPSKNTNSRYERDFADWLLNGNWTIDEQWASRMYRYDSTSFEYPGYDGWYNNVGKPELGAVDTPLLRRLPATYEDGVYKPSGSDRPGPLELSEKLLKGKIGTKSKTGRNALLVFFGM